MTLAVRIIHRLQGPPHPAIKSIARAIGCSPQWITDCLIWRGRVLTGKHGHWCYEWDDLPVDETCDEWPCSCKIDDDAPLPPEALS